MKIGIVGWGIEGQSVFNYFGPEHEYLIVNEHPRDDFPVPSEKIKIQFLDKEKPTGLTGNAQDLSYLDGLEDCDKIVYSPTARKNLEKHFGDNQDFWSKATTERHIFFETVKTKNIIGVTGTKGKGTTSTLIYQMLQASGKTVYLGGNIGRSVLEFVDDVQPDDWVVLELSSFQLYKFPYSPRIAVCLMLVPEHLDYHDNLEEYIEAKSNLFSHQSVNDIAIYFDGNEYSRQLAFRSPGIKLPFYQTPGARVREDGKIVIGEPEVEVIGKEEIKLLGEHNLQNVCAALTAVWQVSQDIDAARKILTEFLGLEHRIEFVREFDGIKFYNDSFATAPGATIAALKAVPGHKVIIIGGYDRMLPLEKLAKEIAAHSDDLRKILLIGQSAQRTSEALNKEGYNNFETSDAKDMSTIVKTARSFSQNGDTVVLSPGFASFDMFKNFAERGQKFKDAVYSL